MISWRLGEQLVVGQELGGLRAKNGWLDLAVIQPTQQEHPRASPQS